MDAAPDKGQSTNEKPASVAASVTSEANGGTAAQADHGATLIEPTQALGGVLPLKQGFFVADGSTCEDPPNAALRRYDGVGLNRAHTRDCKIQVLSAKGATYEIEQTCTDAGEGPAGKSSDRSTVSIASNLEFTQKRSGEAETFRYCPASRLPPGIAG